MRASRIGASRWRISSNPHIRFRLPIFRLALPRLKRQRQLGAKTERERDYIDALSVMYVDYDKIPHQARVQSYLKAMEALAGRYPADDEAQIFYAIALNVAASPSDKTYANQLKGAAILGPIMERQPQHPGVAHYLIHLYDYPPIAAKGLPPALRYAKIAPNAPHAQHMPSHIFTRVGYWKDSIAANHGVRSGREGQQGSSAIRCTARIIWSTPICSSVRTRMRSASSAKSRHCGPDPDSFAAAFAQAAAPARYMVERGDWNGAANLEVKPSKFPHATAITHFARAIGAARSGKIDAAKADTAKLAELRDKLRDAKNGYWAGQVDVQEQVATAWVLYASGKHDEALKVMSAAVDAEDNTEKSPVTPGPLAPARELYGAMLLDRGMAKEALAVFEATMAKEPNRYNGYVGAAMAAQGAGDAARAKANYGKLIELAAEF